MQHGGKGMTTLGLVFLIGVLAGLRSLTPPAAMAWAAHWAWFKLPRALSWVGTTPAVAIFTVLALVELCTDKLPSAPRRTVPVQFSARIIMGAFAGACLASAGGRSALLGVLLGAAGAVAGTLGGYHARVGLAKLFNSPDLPLALTEDIVTIAGSFYVASRF
jgi:uncharacterized membrane protein